MEMEFSTQRELLEYLGKHPDDRKLVQRMMKRWEVYKKDGVYYLIDNFRKKAVWDLYDEIRELRGKVEQLEDNVYSFNWVGDYNEAKAQWEYYQDLYEKEKADKQFRIRKCFRWIQTIKPRADWEEFRDWVMSDEE